MDFDTLELGREAARLLRDPTLPGAMARAERPDPRRMVRHRAARSARREELHAELRALRRVKGRIQAMETDAKQIDDRRRLRA